MAFSLSVELLNIRSRGKKKKWNWIKELGHKQSRLPKPIGSYDHLDGQWHLRTHQ
jgi:hypothetical protein